MLIFRVEHAIKKIGPYRLGLLQNFKELYNSNKYPNPYDEGLNFFQNKHICGFSSIKQHKKWFNKDYRKLLHQMAMVLNIYSVEDKYCEIGKKQCIFEKDKGLLITTVSIT